MKRGLLFFRFILLIGLFVSCILLIRRHAVLKEEQISQALTASDTYTAHNEDITQSENTMNGSDESFSESTDQETSFITETKIETDVKADDDPSGKPKISPDDWKFILANHSHSIADYHPQVEDLEGIQLDYRIIQPMEEFVQAARDQGLSVFLSSGYRSYEEQSWLYEMKVEEYGEEYGRMIVNPPGTSEHQTGLAADITDQYYETKKQELEYTDLYQWMSAHCHEYGFIVRYPKNKEDITEVIFEPWHFRYVGVEAATYIMENDLTLEEFLDLYS